MFGGLVDSLLLEHPVSLAARECSRQSDRESKNAIFAASLDKKDRNADHVNTNPIIFRL
jgi:hypothetical protein